MTTDFGMLDLKEGKFPPVKLRPKHRADLLTTISQVMVAFGARPAEVLSSYSQAPIVWEIPSLYSDRLVTSSLTISVNTSKVSGSAAIHACYNDVAKLVAKDGMGPAALDRLQETFGKGVRHPLLFTETARSDGARALFGMEWACMLHSQAEQATFQANHAFVRLSTNFFTPPMGVVGGRFENGFKVPEGFMEECLYTPRGFINFHTFDAFDRANVWVMQNFALLTEPEKLLRGLCLLKLAQSPKLAYDFEQSLRNLTEAPYIEPTLKSLMYTEDQLNCIRDIWVDQDKPVSERLYMLHLQLVPGYLDDGQFKRLFKYMPGTEGRATYKVEMDIAAGLEKFILLFLQTQRAIASGKRMGMRS